MEELRKLGAQNIVDTNNEIEFRNNVRTIGLQTKMMSMVSAGKILIRQNDQIIIEYSYKVPINLPIVAIILFILLGLFINTFAFIGCFFVIFGVFINIISIKEKNNNFLSRIRKRLMSFSTEQNSTAK